MLYPAELQARAGILRGQRAGIKVLSLLMCPTMGPYPPAAARLHCLEFV